ncbi:hypothetical protein ACWD6R_24925 [Streptomyces sp. NPDC005151]
MTAKKSSEAASAPAPSRRRMIGTITGLGTAAALATVATPAEAQSQGSHGAPSGSGLSPRRVAAAFYASYNGDLAAGFERCISKDLVLQGFDGPNERSAWVAGDLELKASLTGYRLDVFDQIAEGTKVVTRCDLLGLGERPVQRGDRGPQRRPRQGSTSESPRSRGVRPGWPGLPGASSGSVRPARRR